jgi:hypothetical protein
MVLHAPSDTTNEIEILVLRHQPGPTATHTPIRGSADLLPPGYREDANSRCAKDEPGPGPVSPVAGLPETYPYGK